jgi:hypothetical protein
MFNHMVKEEYQLGNIKGIALPWGLKHQTISQYVDNITIMMKGEETNLCEIINLLHNSHRLIAWKSIGIKLWLTCGIKGAQKNLIWWKLLNGSGPSRHNFPSSLESH